MTGSEVIKIDGAVRAGIIGDSNAIGEDADFDGLPNLITAVIDSVDEGFLQGFIGVVEESLCLGLPTLLDNDLLDEDGIDIGKGLLDHAIQRAFENLFSEDIASRSVGKLDDINLGLGKEAVRIVVEKEQAHVERFEHFSGAGDDVHLAAELGKVQSLCVVIEIAPHLPQEIPDQGQVQIVNGSLMSAPVIEGNGGRQAYKFHFIIAVCPDSGGGLADVIGKFIGLLREGERGFIGPGLTARRPENQDVAILNDIGGDDGVIGRLDPVTQSENLFLDFVYSVNKNSGGRQDGLTILLINTDYNVASAQIMKVVGKGTKRM
jgi:hypothetical protein